MNKIGYLLLDKIKIQGANAISSPITYGFPALTGFLGAIHALNRKIVALHPIHFDGVLVACHDYQLYTYREHDFADYKFSQARRPLTRAGESPAIIQEGKINLIVSLMIEMKGEREIQRWMNKEENVLAFKNEVMSHLQQQRMAGGSVLHVEEIKYFIPAESANILKQSLLPAFVLMDAKNHITEMTIQLKEKNPDATNLDALIETCKIHHVPITDKNDKVKWAIESIKKGRGWIVPIPVGYQAISPCFEKNVMQNTRSAEYPSQYVECLYSLGRWVFPSSMGKDQDKWFWRYHYQDNLYLINQN